MAKEQTPSVLFIANVERSHPLLRSQGIPLVDRLSLEGYRVGFLSIENAQTLQSKDNELIQAQLADRVTFFLVRMDRWMWLRGWVRKLLWGILGTLRVQRKYRFQILHARSFEPAVMAWLATLIYGGKWIYDTRNFYFEEKVELGRSKNDLFLRLGTSFDHFLIRKADKVIAVTEAAGKLYSKQLGCHEGLADRIRVVHNNYNPTRFGRNLEIRRSRRKELQVEDRIVLIYSGSLVQWYLFKEMAAFCNRFQNAHPQSSTLWCSYEWTDESKRWANTLLKGNVQLLKLSPDEVGITVQSADAGLMFLQLTMSNTTTFPIKFAEYLACGLPVVINRGLESPEEIIRRYQVGVVVEDMSDNGMDRAVEELLKLLNDPELSKRAQEAARKEFHLDQAIEKYQQCYQTLLRK